MNVPFVLVWAKFFVEQVLTREPDMYLDLEAGQLVEMGWGQTTPPGPPTRHLTLPYLRPEALAIASRFPGPNPPVLPGREQRDLRLCVAAVIAAQQWLESRCLPVDIFWYEAMDLSWFGMYGASGREELGKKMLVYRAGQRKWECSARSLASLEMELLRARGLLQHT